MITGLNQLLKLDQLSAKLYSKVKEETFPKDDELALITKGQSQSLVINMALAYFVIVFSSYEFLLHPGGRALPNLTKLDRSFSKAGKRDLPPSWLQSSSKLNHMGWKLPTGWKMWPCSILVSELFQT